MKEVICDTNIWYGLGDGTIAKPENIKLYATWNNLIEIGFSHPNLKKNIDIDSVKNAAKAILDFSDGIIEEDPFTYSANKIAPELNLKTKSLKHILGDIVSNGLPNQVTYAEHDASYTAFMKMKKDFSEGLNSQKKELRKSILISNIEKNKFKIADKEQIFTQAYSVLLDVESFLNKEHELKIEISDEDDFQNTLNEIISKFELYVNVKQKFLKKWVLDKHMQVDANDFYDILNLVYIEKGKYYWTKENRWLSVMKEAGMNDYMWE